MTGPAVPHDLLTRYREGRTILFVGAGISGAVEWTSTSGAALRGVSWRGLVDQAAKLLGFTEPDLLRVRGTDLQILEYFALRRSRAELTNWFLQEMNPPDAALLASQVHKRIAALDKCNLIYTTNFDNFLERSFELHKRLFSVVATEAHIAQHLSKVTNLPTGDRLPCEIIKFHGDLNHPDRMVLSESDYEDRLSFANVEDQRLRADMLGRAVLFLGYSFSDWNVAYLFRLVQQIHGTSPESTSGKRAYITVITPSDFEYQLFARRGIEVIPIGSKDPSADIAALLETLAS